MQLNNFEYYFNSYYKQVYNYILKRIQNSADAEDLAMDSFIAAHQNFHKFDDKRASFATWLYVIVNNRIKNYYRDHKESTEIDDNMPDISSFEDEIIKAECLQNIREHLYIALDMLSSIQRTVVVQKYFFNKNSPEIAQITGLTPGNVRVNLSRALNILREYFNKENIEWEF